MLRHRAPSGLWRLQAVLGDGITRRRVDGQFIVEAQPDDHGLATVGLRDAVAVATDLNVAVPADLAQVVVTGIEVCCRQRLESRHLGSKAFRWDLSELP